MDRELKARKTAVLLLAYGAAETIEALPAYLQDILGERPLSDKLLSDVTARYQAIGGKSPLIDITREQAQRLQASLSSQESSIKTYVGMRHSPPTIKSAIEEIRAEGFSSLVALPMTPYHSDMSVGAYRRALESALKEGEAEKIFFIDAWHEEPLLIKAFAEKIIQARESLPERARAQATLLLTAHSLPERIVKEGDPYPGALKQTAERTAAAAGFTNWRFAYQSKGGSGREPWLGPEAGDVLRELKEQGVRSVVLSPIGFISDHMETLYDDDVLYKNLAEELGVEFVRAEALNTSPLFIEALANVVRRRLTEVK